MTISKLAVNGQKRWSSSDFNEFWDQNTSLTFKFTFRSTCNCNDYFFKKVICNIIEFFKVTVTVTFFKVTDPSLPWMYFYHLAPFLAPLAAQTMMLQYILYK